MRSLPLLLLMSSAGTGGSNSLEKLAVAIGSPARSTHPGGRSQPLFAELTYQRSDPTGGDSVKRLSVSNPAV